MQESDNFIFESITLSINGEIPKPKFISWNYVNFIIFKFKNSARIFYFNIFQFIETHY